jgi:tetratricopeptide (TPR) repeat protein
MYQTRPRRPYEKKVIKRSSALVFGLGLGVLAAAIAILFGLAMPGLSPHLDNLAYRARSYYRKLMPHPEYLPTPAPTPVMAAAVADLFNPTPRPILPTFTSTPSLTPTPTVQPAIGTPTAAATPLPPAPTVALTPLAEQAQLTGLTHQWQTWNNCGPATITMNMSHFGHTENQAEAALFLKPNRDDKNVNPEELAAYARTTGLEAIVRRGGSVDLIKQLLSHNLPVLAETWLVHDGDGLGHYRLITGYDDTTGQFNTFDSLNGPDYKVAYDQFDADWRVFNRLYLIVYPPEQANLVAAIIGPDMAETAVNERLAAEAQAEVATKPNEAIAFFNLGDALTRLERYDEAVTAFDRARQLGLHWRRLWYQFTPFEAYYATGRYQDVLDLADATIKGAGGLEEAYYYRGLALQATGQPGAVEAFEAALAYNSNFASATEALENLTNESQ